MSALHFNPIQNGGVAAIGWSSYLIPAFSGAMQVLLAAVLLAVVEWSARGVILHGHSSEAISCTPSSLRAHALLGGGELEVFVHCGQVVDRAATLVIYVPGCGRRTL
jgi:hypothetical protein